MNSIQVFFLFYIFVLVKSFHPSQHDIRRNIKAWGGYFFSVGCCCCWSGGNVSIESEENGPTQWSRGEQRSLWFQRTNETPLSVLTQKNEDAIHQAGSIGTGQKREKKRPITKARGVAALLNLTRARSCPSSRHVYWPLDVPFLSAAQSNSPKHPPLSRFIYIYIALKPSSILSSPFFCCSSNPPSHVDLISPAQQTIYYPSLPFYFEIAAILWRDSHRFVE